MRSGLDVIHQWAVAAKDRKDFTGDQILELLTEIASIKNRLDQAKQHMKKFVELDLATTFFGTVKSVDKDPAAISAALKTNERFKRICDIQNEAGTFLKYDKADD
jgi:hypothetical protein